MKSKKPLSYDVFITALQVCSKGLFQRSVPKVCSKGLFQNCLFSPGFGTHVLYLLPYITINAIAQAFSLPAENKISVLCIYFMPKFNFFTFYVNFIYWFGNFCSKIGQNEAILEQIVVYGKPVGRNGLLCATTLIHKAAPSPFPDFLQRI